MPCGLHDGIYPQQCTGGPWKRSWVSLCAVLLAEACNIGREPLIRPDVPALTFDRLVWVQQNYLRETLTRANARLVDAQPLIPLAQAGARSPPPTVCVSSSRSAR